jgi:hypothetical protein
VKGEKIKQQQNPPLFFVFNPQKAFFEKVFKKGQGKIYSNREKRN